MTSKERQLRFWLERDHNMSKYQVAVLGSGSWGTAIAQVLADNQVPVYLYGRNQSEVDEINQKHTNSKFFEESKIGRASCRERV